MNIHTHSKCHGFSLIEVLIAVVVLSFGLLALAALQGGLFRAGAESKARANATAFAQQRIEDTKSFVALKAGAVTSYEAIGTQAFTPALAAGTQFYGCSQVRRYRYDTTLSPARFVRLNDVNFSLASNGTVTCANTGVVAAGAVDAATPEFKEVRVSVGWVGSDGLVKTVEVTDSVAAIAAPDAIMLAQSTGAPRRGPQFWGRPPNLDSSGNIIPEVVPIAISSDGDQAAASSNPKPQQFVSDVSSATLFSVQSYSGARGPDRNVEVLLNRKIDIAVVSCVCANTGAVSTNTSPAYQPTVWNGKQLSYVEPATAPLGKKVGTAIVDNSDRNIKSLCTTCCRDHHDSSAQSLKVDPYRAQTAGAHEHYGYKQQGSSYNIGAGLFLLGSETSNQYVEACRLINVGGRMRLGVDARQNQMLVTPLNGNPGTAFNQSDFITRYSAFVRDYVNYAATNVPANYPGPLASYPASPLPGPTSAQLSTYADINSPTPPISFTAAGQARKMVAFGLYVDYLTPETLAAYNCARTIPPNNTGACLGLGTRDPLEYIPFYAVNLANLGYWESAKPLVVSVANSVYKNGLLETDGGVATAKAGSATGDIPVAETINISNSGLASTAPVDPEDEDPSRSDASDAQNYTKTAGLSPPPSNTLNVKIGTSSALTVNKLNITSPAGGTLCNYSAGTKAAACIFTGPATISVRIGNFTTSKTTGTTTTITDRKICLPADSRVTSLVYATPGAVTETATFNVGVLTAQNYTLTISVVDEISTCPTGTSLVP